MAFAPSPTHTRTRRRRARSVFLSVALVCTAASATLRAAPAQADSVSDENRFVELINGARVAGGLQPLTVHPALIASGRAWATKMRAASLAAGTNGCLISHNPDLRTAVAANWRKLGENVGCGDVDADYLHQKFMDSPAHKANIMDPEFDSIGIGIVMSDDGIMFVTEQFMDSDDRASAPTTSAQPGTPDALALAPTAKVKGVSVLQTKNRKAPRPIRAVPKRK